MADKQLRKEQIADLPTSKITSGTFADALVAASNVTQHEAAITVTASQVSDFDTEVSNNTDVAANTTARHAAVTVSDSSEIDFTLTGQQISAAIVVGSIDESKLDTSVNASLDLADSASQPGHTHTLANVTDVTASAAEVNIMDGVTATTAEINYVDGVTSAIQTQLNAKLANVVEDTTPQLGGALDCNGQNLTDVQELRTDATPDTDHTATGLTTNTINAGATVSIGQLLYLATDGEWALTDASATGTADKLLAIALAAGTDGASLLVALPGSFVRDDTWAWTVGARLFMSETAGAITETAPTTTDAVVRPIGYAISADVIFFQPEAGLIHV